MTELNLRHTKVLVVGAGIMGAGIAQVAAMAGHTVRLLDAREGAAAAAKAKLADGLQALVAKGKLTQAAVDAGLQNIEPITDLTHAADSGLVIEAIVENLDAKRALFKQIEALVQPSCVLASNTSSISITALANGLQRPQQVVGMHFFNPVPVMKLVEVISGLRTDCAVADAIFKLSEHWGKTPVHAQSTPGFIVNRIARPYYAEMFLLLQERAAKPELIDACLRAAGFRMGPCELIDLIGLDTNLLVTQSVYEAYFFDKRYTPSIIQRSMVDGGLLGRKTGEGFYKYPAGAPALPAADSVPPSSAKLRVLGQGPCSDWIEQRLAALNLSVERQAHDQQGLLADDIMLLQTDGRTAKVVSQANAGMAVAVFDRLPDWCSAPGAVLAWATTSADSQALQAKRWLTCLGLQPQRMADAPGLVVARTLAMLINEASDAVLQGVCDANGADAAMKLGVNYPAGPFEWLRGWSASGVMQVLAALDDDYKGERYRASAYLKRL
jgi:3-hydroxybutyryl-CoA dehydrogenase